MYLTTDDYLSLCGVMPSQTCFRRLELYAERIIDAYTTGIDGVRKLKIAFPTDEDDKEAVMRCICEVIRLIEKIEESEAAQQISVNSAHGAIASVSSGSESISYSAGTTAIDHAVSDLVARRDLFQDTVKLWLSGVKDANGVNLLFMGVYPCIRTR